VHQKCLLALADTAVRVEVAELFPASVTLSKVPSLWVGDADDALPLF
jgi:hypothetical protein